MWIVHFNAYYGQSICYFCGIDYGFWQFEF